MSNKSPKIEARVCNVVSHDLLTDILDITAALAKPYSHVIGWWYRSLVRPCTVTAVR